MSQRLRFMLAQLGSKPGGRELLARLLSADDLPGGGWRRVGQRTWRTGASASTPWGDRAREAGSVTAWRSFRDHAGRGVWVQVIPLASASDALGALGEVGALALHNPLTTIVDESDIDMGPFAGASAVWAHEFHSTGPGSGGATRILAGAVEENVVVVTAIGQSWDWPSVSDLATLQAQRLSGEATR